MAKNQMTLSEIITELQNQYRLFGDIPLTVMTEHSFEKDVGLLADGFIETFTNIDPERGRVCILRLETHRKPIDTVPH